MANNNQLPHTLDKNGIAIDHTTPTPRYSVINEESLNDGIGYLNEHGYAVFSDVMQQDEIDRNKNLLWNFLENIPGRNIRRDKPETWSDGWPSFSKHGVINNCGIGQSDFMWSVRSNRQIKRIYSRIWNTRELLVSFDGCGVYRDWRYQPEWKTSAGWYHVDQSPVMKPDRCCVQGFMSLTDQNETTGGLIVFPGTHLLFAELNSITRGVKDFVPVPSTHPILDRGRMMGKLVQCQKGDFIVWDSRLVHCNSPAYVTEEQRNAEPVDLLRIVAYVSMSPSVFIRNQTLDQFRKKRKQAAQDNCTLTHWSTELKASKSNVNVTLPKYSLKKLDAYQRALLIGVADEDEE